MPFIVRNSGHTYIKDLIESQTKKFFDREFASYSEPELKEEGIGFIGSVADRLRLVIESEMKERGWRLRAVEKQPLDSLVEIFKLMKS